MSAIPSDPSGHSTGPSPTSDRNRRIDQFRSNTFRTRLTQTLLMAQLVLLVIGSVTVRVGAEEPHLMWDTSKLQLALAPFTLAAFCAWMYRAYWNLIPLGARDIRRLPILAIVSIFIPGLNLFIPFRALAQMEKWSDSSLADRHPGGSSRGGSISLGWAWASFVNLTAFNDVTYSFIKKNIKIPAAAIGDLSDQMQAFLGVQLLLALYFVVRGIDAAQTERHRRLSVEASRPGGE
jgi:hypothetical protein